MSGKFRRMIIIMLISISMILLVSCGTMEVSTNVKVNKDGSSNTVFRLVYDESIKKVVGDGLLQQVLGTETEINVYSQDNNTVEEATIITPKIDIKDLLKSNTLNISNFSYDDGEFIKYDVKREKGFLKDKYKVNIGLTKDLLAEIDSNIENIIKVKEGTFLCKKTSSFNFDDICDMFSDVGCNDKTIIISPGYNYDFSSPYFEVKCTV